MHIEDDTIGSDPARTIYRRGLQKKVNRQACRKASGIIDTESVGESIIVVAGEVDPRVRRIIPQPATFDLNTGETYPTKTALAEALHGRRYKPWVYTPDFLFELVDGGSLYVEGKHTRWIQENPKFSLVLGAMEELGHRLRLVTEKAFTPALHQNLRSLRALRNRQLEASRRAWVIAHAPDSFAFGHAQSALGLRRSEVYAALFEGILATDLSLAPFGDRTKLVRVEDDLRHLELLPL